jgi:TRAP-type C4-dicarboxylate transport system permease large subunit
MEATIYLLIATFGIHPVHFGIIMVTNLVIGLITPPYGVALFVTSVVGKIKLEILTKAILPYLLINLAVLALISYFPQVVLFLPKLFGLI